MAGSRPAARLERYAAEAGAKLIEFRDSRQLQSVLAGGDLHGVHERLGGLALRTARRQHRNRCDRSHDARSGASARHDRRSSAPRKLRGPPPPESWRIPSRWTPAMHEYLDAEYAAIKRSRGVRERHEPGHADEQWDGLDTVTIKSRPLAQASGGRREMRPTHWHEGRDLPMTSSS